MTEKERAKDLVQKFASLNPSRITTIPIARESAKVCVDTILEGQNLLRLPLSYWEGVKKEIEKL